MAIQRVNGNGYSGQSLRMAERDMPARERGLVDTCFEEGQYETGISVLNELRDSRFKPCAAHIRQLLFLALYPDPHSLTAGQSGASSRANKFTVDGSIPATPSKLTRRQHNPYIPTEAACEAARDLLLAFALTNNPETLFSALPKYAIDSSGIQAPAAVNEEDDDSPIARWSVQIRNAKNCWELLREGFIRRLKAEMPSSPRKGRGKKRGRPYDEFDDDDSIDFSVLSFGQPSVIGRYAWSTFRWMLDVFEKDETISEQNVQPRYSPLLLSQIPPPRTASGLRWDTQIPLDIVIHCLHQSDTSVSRLGVRLLYLLINLTSTTHIDLSMFTSAMCSRLQTSLSWDELALLIKSLPIQPKSGSAINYFRIAFFKQYLSNASSGSKTVARPGPRAKAQPRPAPARGRPQEDSLTPLSNSGTSTPASSVSPDVSKLGTSPIGRSFPSTPSSEILRLLSTCSATSSSSPSSVTRSEAVVHSLQIKYELLRTYASFQFLADQKDRDTEWPKILSSGKLAQEIEAVFAWSTKGGAKAQIDTMKSILLVQVQTVRSIPG